MTGWTTREELVQHVVSLAREKVSRRAIATSLGVSRNTVRRILEEHTVQRGPPPPVVSTTGGGRTGRPQNSDREPTTSVPLLLLRSSSACFVARRQARCEKRFR